MAKRKKVAKRKKPKQKTMFRTVLKQLGQETLDSIRARRDPIIRLSIIPQLQSLQEDASAQTDEIMGLIYGRRRR